MAHCIENIHNLRHGYFSDPRAIVQSGDLDLFGGISEEAVPAGRWGAPVLETQTYFAILESLTLETSSDTWILFEDKEFPTERSSLYFREVTSEPLNVEFIRPRNLDQDAEFIATDIENFWVHLEVCHNHPFALALTCLSLRTELIYQCVPLNQTFNQTEGYAGIFRFRFWRFGEWREVLIDDNIPFSREGDILTPKFLISTSNDYWPLLLEKAYAKLHGCYEALATLSVSDILTDLTGGVVENFELEESAFPQLVDNMFQGQSHGAFMVAFAKYKFRVGETDSSLTQLCSITGVNTLAISSDQTLTLIRLRSHWGDLRENWNGPWSDESVEWTSLTKEQKQRLNLELLEETEFWMRYEDFCLEFDTLLICHPTPQSLGSWFDHNSQHCLWETQIIDGQWKKGITSGGDEIHEDNFWANPQFLVQFLVPDEEIDDRMLSTSVIALMLEPQIAKPTRFRPSELRFTIFFYTYPKRADNERPKRKLGQAFFMKNKPILSYEQVSGREIVCHLELPTGPYIVVVATNDPNYSRRFILRILSQQDPTSTAPRIQRLELPNQIAKPHTNDLPKPLHKSDIIKLKSLFDVAVGPSCKLNSSKLLKILNKSLRQDSFFTGFSLDSVRSLVSMKDLNREDALTFADFHEIWEQLRFWKKTFNRYDELKQGKLDPMALRRALLTTGIQIEDTVQNVILARFSNDQGFVEFNDFVHAVARLNFSFAQYEAYTKMMMHSAIKSGQVTISLLHLINLV